MAAGEFTPSQLLQIKLKAEQMWADSQYAKSLQVNSVAAQALLANQTARIRPLEDKEKDLTVKINWVNTCAVEAEDCESNCDLTEDELETSGKDYALDLCKKSGFSIDAEKLRTNTYSFDELAAPGLNAAIKALDEYWARQVLVKFKAFAGINVAPGDWAQAANVTTIPSADYNLDAIVEILYQQVQNKMTSAYFVNNGDLWKAYKKAELSQGNADGRGDAALANQLNTYFDLFNFSPAGISESTFMVAPGAVAMTTKTRNPNAPTQIGGQVNHTVFTVASKTLPGVSYDVYYTLKCVTVNGKAHIMHTWRLETNGGIFLNPEGCTVSIDDVDYNPTGVIAFKKGA